MELSRLMLLFLTQVAMLFAIGDAFCFAAGLLAITLGAFSGILLDRFRPVLAPSVIVSVFRRT